MKWNILIGFKGKKLFFSTIILSILLSSSSFAQQTSSIGKFSAVYGETGVTHPGALVRVAARLRDDVFFQDLIETLERSKAKVLFIDDTILNIGERTKIEITEHIFNPEKDVRSTVIKLIDGRVRALVGRFFSGPDSKFEVHTPTAVAAARGSYGIFWVQEVEGKVQTGVLNLKGAWEVKNIDPAIVGSIILKEGEASLVGLGLPPILLPEVKHEIITATEVRDQHKEEKPKKEEIPGRDISVEKPTPLSVILSATAPTAAKDEKTKETTETKTTTTTGITLDTTTTTTPTIPPIVNQPSPTTSLVHIEVNFR